MIASMPSLLFVLVGECLNRFGFPFSTVSLQDPDVKNPTCLSCHFDRDG